MEDCCKHGNDSWGDINVGNFLVIGDYQAELAPWS